MPDPFNLKTFLVENKSFKFDFGLYETALTFRNALDERIHEFEHSLAHHNKKTVDNSTPLLSKAELRNHVASLNEKSFDHIDGPVWLNHTSGTSGLPMPVYYDSATYFSHYYHTILKCMLRYGRAPRSSDVFSVYITDNPKYTNSIQIDPCERIGAVIVYKLGADASEAEIRKLILFLKKYQPQVVNSKPGLLTALALKANKSKVCFDSKLSLVVSSGAMLFDEARTLLEQFFKSPVANALITTELTYIGSECRHRNIHIDTTCHTPETLEAGGELVITNTKNKAYPLVRYRTGDKAELIADGCACSMPGPYLKSISGRISLIFHLSNDRMIAPSQWMNVFLKHPDLVNYRATQTCLDNFLFEIETKSDDERLLSPIISYFKDSLPNDISTRFELTKFKDADKFIRFRSEVI